MFIENSKTFELPYDKDEPIWRYMDFTKFVHMLESNALHFTRPDHFSDPFEGAVSRFLREDLEEYYSQRRLNLPRGPTTHYQDVRKCVCVNCWHMNPHESEAMWKLYLKSGEGIAVRSTYSRLAASFDNDDNHLIHAGTVKYIDYDHDAVAWFNPMLGLMHKRKSFEHERELRAVAYKVNVRIEPNGGSMEIQGAAPEAGLDLGVDLSKLVEAIYVSPVKQKWFSTLVESVVRRYGFAFPVVQSDLGKVPEW